MEEKLTYEEMINKLGFEKRTEFIQDGYSGVFEKVYYVKAKEKEDNYATQIQALLDLIKRLDRRVSYVEDLHKAIRHP